MAGRLETLGYTPRMVQVHLQFAGSFSEFLLRHGASADDVGSELVEEFVAELRAKAPVAPRRGTPSRCYSSATATTSGSSAAWNCTRSPTTCVWWRCSLAVQKGRRLEELVAGYISRFMHSPGRTPGDRAQALAGWATRSTSTRRPSSTASPRPHPVTCLHVCCDDPHSGVQWGQQGQLESLLSRAPS